MAKFPRDRFDEVPEHDGRVGAHRAPRDPLARWRALGVAALATGLLVVAGVGGLAIISDRVNLDLPVSLPGAGEPEPAPTEAPVETAPPVTDPATITLPEGFSITVLNGSGITGLGQQAADVLTPLGWPVGAVTNAAQDDLATTVVYYDDPTEEGIARGLVQLLGVGEVEFSDAFPGARVTVAVGADYAG
ncbi:LytR C-terminal domain-containing protein [Microcella flavibacter]|uniref:LytR C-terminal domain-containing protein n=1 Tax=Microcella flavibacter TaxID=1804990 RepID=UPI00145682A9|nr:LytR C-terminal domain-containing protein [Microcella flavibacter]